MPFFCEWGPNTSWNYRHRILAVQPRWRTQVRNPKLKAPISLQKVCQAFGTILEGNSLLSGAHFMQDTLTTQSA
ncbi:hypothetical protein P692DRAFT_201794944 [Suillus brevipes Sb2]|nr:hypothetical protein P692DRAFT_201794944 [Suillus brevipes Sb2]